MNEIELENYYRQHPEELYGVEQEFPTTEEIDDHYEQIMKGVINDND